MKVGDFRVATPYERYVPKLGGTTNDDTHLKRFLKAASIDTPSNEYKEVMKDDIERPTQSKQAELVNEDAMPKTSNLTKAFRLPTNAGKKPSEKSRIFTKVYHNDKPFFVEIASKKSTRCSACGVDIAFRREKPPFDLVVRHSERWEFPSKSDPNTKIPTSKYRDAYYHLALDCLTKRFPYFDSDLLRTNVNQRCFLNAHHTKYLASEFNFKI